MTLADGLAANGLATPGALARLIRAVDVFGFHLARLDLRQNSDVHARCVADLLCVGGVEADYVSLAEDARVALLVRELANPRPLTGPQLAHREETRSELAILAAAADARARFGAATIGSAIVSKTDALSDLLELMLLLKEAGLYRAGDPAASLMPVPLFETIGDLEAAPAIMRAFFACAPLAELARDDVAFVAEAVNRLLVVGFYLLNLGYAALIMKAYGASSAVEAAEVLATIRELL